MSRTLSPAMASTGNAQNGWIILVHASPHPTAIAVFATSAPTSRAAWIMIGPCTAHCPPPEGIKKLTIPALINEKNGRVKSVEKLTNQVAIMADSPEPTIIPIIPA